MKIVIATCEDWDALYIDGINKMEEHVLYAADLVMALKENAPCIIGKEDIEIKSVDEQWWYGDDRDCYPDKIEDVVFEEE